MIISDLSYLEDVSEAPTIVGGLTTIDGGLLGNAMSETLDLLKQPDVLDKLSRGQAGAQGGNMPGIGQTPGDGSFSGPF